MVRLAVILDPEAYLERLSSVLWSSVTMIYLQANAPYPRCAGSHRTQSLEHPQYW
jgi:hypothetical protein